MFGRYELCIQVRALPWEFWVDCVFWLDEVKVKFLRGANLTRALASKIRFVFRRPDERYHPDCVKPQGSKMEPGGAYIPLFAIMARGQMPVLMDQRPYMLQYSQTDKGMVDRYVYARMLQDAMPAVRQALGPRGHGTIIGVQDNWRVHTAAWAAAAAAAENIRWITICARSPDLNRIERPFGICEYRCNRRYRTEGAPLTEAAFLADINAEFAAMAQDGTLLKQTKKMPNVVADVIANNGGPTRH